MPIYESEQYSRDKLFELRKKNRCQVCGGRLNVFLDPETHKAFLACWDWLRTRHNGIVREASQYEQKGIESLNIKSRREIMVNQFGETGVALERYHGVTSLTREEAKEILLTVFPDAPEVEMTRAVLLCASYSLNPLMGHVFLIPFNKGKPNESWATVIGIKAKRLLASRKRAFSFVDDTPRLMTKEEQEKVFGKVDGEHIVAITVLQDPGTGAIARGYGKWGKGTTVYGTDKGNSAENMAFIRSESQALDRLCPGEMPVGVGVVDEQFVAPKGEVIEGAAREVTDEPLIAEPKSKEPEESKKPTPPKVTPLSAEAPGKEPVSNTIEALKETMKLCNWTAQDLGQFCVNEKKWKIKEYKDLTPEQIKELIEDIKKNPK